MKGIQGQNRMARHVAGLKLILTCVSLWVHQDWLQANIDPPLRSYQVWYCPDQTGGGGGSLGAFGANSPPSLPKDRSAARRPHSGASQVLLSGKSKGSSSHRLKEGKFNHLAVSTVTAFVAHHSSKKIHSGSFGLWRIQCFGGEKASHCFRCKRRWASSAGEKVERHRKKYWIACYIYKTKVLAINAIWFCKTYSLQDIV